MGKLTVLTGNWASRNRFLCIALAIWGIINFCCWLNDCHDDNVDFPELLAASAFIIGFTAICALVMLSLDSFEQIIKYVIMALFIIGGLLHIIGGILWTDEWKRCGTECGFWLMGGLYEGGIMWPALTAFVIAFDLFKRHLDNIRWRIIVESSVLILVSLIYLCSWDYGWDHGYQKSFGRRIGYIGFLQIMLVSLVILIVIGILQKKNIAALNFICALLLFIGWMFIIFNNAENAVCSSTYVICWMVLGCHIYILAFDAQDGGTLPFINKGSGN